MPSRDSAIARARGRIDDGSFVRGLSDLVAYPTESQDPARRTSLARYLAGGIQPMIERMGFESHIARTPGEPALPCLIARREEDPALPTVLIYGHGDVVRAQEQGWGRGLAPFRAVERDGMVYGRGTADNKGQHWLNLCALEAVLAEREGRLGFNTALVIETGEEMGSPGLDALFEAERDRLAADVLIASDGTRLRADLPTLFLGSRGVIEFALDVQLRRMPRHSGGFGGIIADPGIRLANAIAAISGPMGRIEVPGWRPDSLTPSVRAALADCPVSGDGLALDADWGEPGLTPAERLWGWNSFSVLSLECGDPAAPVNAIQPRASAFCQLRFVVGTEPDQVIPALRAHLDGLGFTDVTIREVEDRPFRATRLDPDSPWARWAVASITRTIGRAPAVLPNHSGSLPNHLFAETLGLPTIWVPHSYPGSRQHAPDEHMRLDVAREGLAIMAGLWWDLGESGGPAA